VELRNRDRDATPFVTKDGSTIREYLHTERQSLAEASLEAGHSTQRHYHAASEEIYLILEGSGRLEVEGEVHDVGPGDAILIPPGAWHELAAGHDGARLLCCCVPPYSDADTFFTRPSDR
jgi:quercetin dioxygenase-like cupin family protein